MNWGVDLGVRSAHAVGLDQGVPILTRIDLKPKQHSRSDELRLLYEWALKLRGSPVRIEEPPLAGRRSIRTFLHLAQVSGVVAAASGGTLIPVDSWKQATVGKGGVNKDAVSDWLRGHHRPIWELCGGNQNFVDAACLALMG